jgi:glycosyltransferase involved in cell wall biosynthesis
MPNTPTVLHVTLASDAGGLSRYIIDVGLEIRRLGWRVAVAGDAGAWHDKFLASGLEFIDIPLKGGVIGFQRSKKILRDWQRANGPIHLLHTHYRRATRLARKLQIGQTPPILYTLHLSHLNVSGWRRLVSDFGDHCHIASEDARHWLVHDARVDTSRVHCIPHGIAIEKWPITTPAMRAVARRALHLSDDTTVALFVGRLDEQKQPNWFVDAGLEIIKANPRARFILVGDGPDRAVLESTIGNRKSEIQILGERDPLQAYQAADLLVSCSWREGFGYAPAEALCTGLPVLRTRTSGTHETIVENVTGRSVRIDKPDFVAACREMLGNRDSLRAMAPACAAHAREHLRFDQQIHRTLALYQSIATLNGRS